MTKTRQHADAMVKNLRVSPRKLSLVLAMIRGKKVEHAIRDLTFCSKSIALEVKKCLRSALSNAENNFGLDIDNLFVSKAVASKALLMKRYRARAKGRAGRIEKFFSNMYITVKVMEAV